MPGTTRISLDSELSALQAFINAPGRESGAKEALRSPKSQPRNCVFALLHNQQSEMPFERWQETEIERLTLAVGMAAQKRPHDAIGSNQAPDLDSGRFLLYSPFLAGGDGLAEANSHGFFDIDDCPPWDTFLTFMKARATVIVGNFQLQARHDGILCWIPNRAVELAQAGINVTPAGSLSWVEMVGR
jgi:hypothetical protein